MSDPLFSICVYCGSRPGTEPAYASAAAAVGQWIASQGGQLVYGGGHGGLMGIVADAALAAGGRVVGVIPKSLVEREWAHHGCTELHIVDTMHERKRMMAQHAHAFLALPGGIGTLEELFEVWTWRQLGYHDKPIGILNTQGYYQGLLDFMQHSMRQGFLNQSQWELVHADSNPAALLRELVQAIGPTPAAPLDLI
ncbi:MAG: TIGR00730 family Rossman fold protein [Burkholderiales bacterium]|nr:TIGR00730 family Rossman fold protein [Burkholderiales bacterium]